jgi:hypothetical protein
LPVFGAIPVVKLTAKKIEDWHALVSAGELRRTRT